MNLLVRFLKLILIRIFYCPSQSLLDPCRTRFMVWPTDLDILGHMNNGKYLSIMDLGRIDLMLRSGYFWRLFRKGIYPVVVSEGIRFRRSLQPFRPFVIDTRIEGFDERYFYIRQTFRSGEQVAAEGIVKGLFLKHGQGTLSTQDVFAAVGEALPNHPPGNLGQRLGDLDQHLAPRG